MKLWEMEVKINNIIDSINSMESSNTLEIGDLIRYGVNNITDEKRILQSGIYDQESINNVMYEYSITKESFITDLMAIQVNGYIYEDADGFTCFRLDYESSEKVNELIKNYTGGVENE